MYLLINVSGFAPSRYHYNQLEQVTDSPAEHGNCRRTCLPNILAGLSNSQTYCRWLDDWSRAWLVMRELQTLLIIRVINRLLTYY